MRVGIPMGFRVCGAYGCVGVWVSFFCLPARLPALLACLPARLACLGARLPRTVSTTRGTVPLTLVTARHYRISSQPYGHFLLSKAPLVRGSRMAGARQAQGRVGLRVAPIGLEFCGEKSASSAGPSTSGPRGPDLDSICVGTAFFFLALQGAGVCSVSHGGCVACFEGTTVTGHVSPDICIMVSPSCIIVIVICSVLTHRLGLWLVSVLRFFFPAVCVLSIERLLNLVIVLMSGTSGTAVLTTPLKVFEARVPRSDRIRCYLPFQFGQS